MQPIRNTLQEKVKDTAVLIRDSQPQMYGGYVRLNFGAKEPPPAQPLTLPPVSGNKRKRKHMHTTARRHGSGIPDAPTMHLPRERLKMQQPLRP